MGGLKTRAAGLSAGRRVDTNLHAVKDAKGRPNRFFMTAGPVSDYTGASALLASLPPPNG
jgi:hypothetical protein